VAACPWGAAQLLALTQLLLAAVLLLAVHSMVPNSA
jgi:hypothetical protein